MEKRKWDFSKDREEIRKLAQGQRLKALRSLADVSQNVFCKVIKNADGKTLSDSLYRKLEQEQQKLINKRVDMGRICNMITFYKENIGPDFNLLDLVGYENQAFIDMINEFKTI